MNYKTRVLGVVAIALAAQAIFANALTDAIDLKPAVMRVYGVRQARSLDDNTIKIVIGASCTPARENAASYRIVSNDDENYAYNKFVKPTKIVLSKPPAKEFVIPEGARPKGFVKELRRAEVTMGVPYALKKGARYSVIAQGVDMTMVTAGTCAASFTHGESNENDPDDGEAIAAQMTGLRRVSSVGDGKILCEFGHGYNVQGGLKLANWKVSINGSPVKIEALGRRSRLECYQPTGWPFSGFVENNIFLDLGKELKNGDKVKVEVSNEVCAGVREGTMKFDSGKSVSRAIKVNQVGYLPKGLKVAYVGQWMGSMPDGGVVSADQKKAKSSSSFTTSSFYGAVGSGTQEEKEIAKEKDAKNAPAAEKAKPKLPSDYDVLAKYALRFREIPSFTLLDVKTRKVAYKGQLKFAHNGLNFDGKSNYSAENVYTADFTEFTKTGDYVLSIEGVGCSVPFAIASDVYERALRVQAQGMYEQRCGCALDPKLTGGWERIACHDKGIVETTVQRHMCGEWGPFLENQVMIPNPEFAGVGERREKVAKSALKLNYELIGETTLQTEKDGTKFYAAGDAQNNNGIVADFAFDPTKGATICAMFKRDDSIAGGNWGGDIIRLGEYNQGFNLSAYWGLVKVRDNYNRRFNDKKWHRFLLRFKPANEKMECEVELSVDGEWHNKNKMIANFSNEKTRPKRVYFGANTGMAEGLYWKDPTVFDRAITDEEIADFASAVATEVPKRINALGGHHDAGDYNPRTHIDVAQQLFMAYELAPENFYDKQLPIPEAGNGIPDIIDEALWAVKVWRGLQDTDGGVFNGTESQGDPNFIQTVELDDKGDFAWAKDTKGTFLAAGIFAQSSRILKKLGRNKAAKDFLERAKKAYEWAVKNPTENIQNLQTHGEYHYTLRAYAAAHLYNTTGDKKYHDDFVEFTPWAKAKKVELISHGNYNLSLPGYAYLLIPKEKSDPAIREGVIKSLREEVEMYVRGSSRLAYKFLKHPYAPVTWGTGAYENFAIAPAVLWKVTGEEKYRDWLIRTCDNTLGNNPLGLSWITGLGTRTIRCPLHNSRYRAAGVAVDGLQGQGPNKNQAGYSFYDLAYPTCAEGFAVMHQFADVHFAIAMDEPTAPNMVNTMFVFGLLCK